jgi:hypothetical protein
MNLIRLALFNIRENKVNKKSESINPKQCRRCGAYPPSRGLQSGFFLPLDFASLLLNITFEPGRGAVW